MNLGKPRVSVPGLPNGKQAVRIGIASIVEAGNTTSGALSAEEYFKAYGYKDRAKQIALPIESLDGKLKSTIYLQLQGFARKADIPESVLDQYTELKDKEGNGTYMVHKTTFERAGSKARTGSADPTNENYGKGCLGIIQSALGACGLPVDHDAEETDFNGKVMGVDLLREGNGMKAKSFFPISALAEEVEPVLAGAIPVPAAF